MSNDRDIPGLDKPFSLPQGISPEPEATKAMNQMSFGLGTDCSEIAENILIATGGKGKILRVEPVEGYRLTLLEGDKLEENLFIYHEVYTDGYYIFDPRLNPYPIFLEEWETLIKFLNPQAKIT
ncbi:hypothetical protein [Aphanothece sacrum]|uniref:tRNA (Guanine-N(7)-)-methyltransferase n=1 Tax=Aphanothece sacrum FPU1 TaxID=1920663 RepID=A0A401ILU3_APHSA|nr:hypothetical protein [Aphanothece sacrum]GBF82219.1 tRNA (guanine-N(7)-)-methyltransferase [Aphanothece sacrum FPU1]GBF87243.1 tRNA (guanine-N(7)-)-methyltransferase [Aphanothece sacrum FPU3]